MAALSPMGASAQARRYYADEDLVRALRYAGLEAGIVFMSAAGPYPAPVIRRALLGIERAENAGIRLSTQARRAAYAAEESLRPQQTAAGIGLAWGLNSALEAYPMAGGEVARVPSWDWAERRPLVSIPLELEVLGLLHARTSIDLKEDYNAVTLDVSPANRSNWVEDFSYLDLTFPFQSVVSVAYGPLSATLGRDVLRWGPGHTGTLLVSDAPDFYEHAELGLSGQALSYRFLLVDIDPSLLDDEEPLSTDVPYWSKKLIAHRFEYLFGERAAMSIVEALVLAGMPLDLSYLSPFGILHNRYAWNTSPLSYLNASSAFGLELRINPWRYVEAYGSFLMNQFQTWYEKERYGDAATATPDAFGWLVGVDAAYPAWGGWLTGGLEYVYTNPWLYIRENRHNSYTWRRRIASNVAALSGKTQFVDASLGYPYGPDTLLAGLWLGWDKPGQIQVLVSLERLVKGENSIKDFAESGPEAVAATSPTGIAETRWNLNAEASIRFLQLFELYGALKLSIVDGYGHQTGAQAMLWDGILGIAFRMPISSMP